MSQSEDQLKAPAPKIRKLDETTVNRIAAGEVVQRPSAAVKEMIENSLDASSTSINITCKQGGIALLQIQDNGHGIRKEDLEIVCERFTTSKIECFEDLKRVTTFGFRGEALASITHVAHVTIVTKTADSQCAFRAKYSDGKLVPQAHGEEAKAKPCAGNKGTIITVEDLFYNMQTRRQAFKNHNEEYQRVLEVSIRYAIHYAQRKVSFTCKKAGATTPDLHTSSEGTTIDAIRAVYGQVVARELIPLDVVGQQDMSSELRITLSGFLSNPNHSSKKSIFILFINDRLVEAASIKRVVDAVYVDILPRHTHPFVYLSIYMPSENIDVNVHPTKKEVHFLYEEQLLDFVDKAFRSTLASANNSRTFLTQTLMTTYQQDDLFTLAEPKKELSPQPINVQSALTSDGNFTQNNDSGFLEFVSGEVDDFSHRQGLKRDSGTVKTEQAYKMIRTDHTLAKINSFFQPQDRISNNRESSRNPDFTVVGAFAKSCACCDLEKCVNTTDATETVPDNVLPVVNRFLTFQETDCQFSSIQTLLSGIRSSSCAYATNIFKKLVYVGVVNGRFSIVQFQTKLLMINHSEFASELFYQLTLRKFGTMNRIIIGGRLRVFDCIQVALESPSAQCIESDSLKEDLCTDMVKFLLAKSAMLDDYFRISIDNEGCLVSLPDLLDGYNPLPEALPLFFLRLVSEVDWHDELMCFQSIAKEISSLYSCLPRWNDENRKGIQQTVSGVLYPAFRAYLFPPAEHSSSSSETFFGRNILQLTSLEKLYKVFERC